MSFLRVGVSSQVLLVIDTTFIHIGLDKTGSTAIQTACFANRSSLQKFGVLYPLAQWHAQFGSAFIKDPAGYFYNIAEGRSKLDLQDISRDDCAYLASLEHAIESSDCTKLILSYEGFSALDYEALCGMRDWLSRKSRCIRIVMYCREPFSYAVSAISQIAKTGLDTSHPPLVHAYIEICEKFSAVFGKDNLRIRKFAKECFPAGDVRLDFLEVIGVTGAEAAALRFDPASMNLSLSAEAIVLSQALAALPESAALTMQEFDARYTSILSAIEGEKYRLTQSQFDYVKLESKPHVDYVKANFGIDIQPPQDLTWAEHSARFGTPFVESVARLLQDFTSKRYTQAAQGADELHLLERLVVSPALDIQAARCSSGIRHERGQLISFEIEFLANRPLRDVSIGIHIFDSKSRWVYGTNSEMLGIGLFNVDEGLKCATYYVIADLAPGRYSAGFSFNERTAEAEVELAWQGRSCDFEILAVTPARTVGYVDLPASVGIRSILEVQREEIPARTAPV